MGGSQGGRRMQARGVEEARVLKAMPLPTRWLPVPPTPCLPPLWALCCSQRKRMGLLEGWRRERAQFFEDTAALLEEQTQMAVARAETAADRWSGWGDEG